MANIVSQNTSPTLNLKNIEDLGSTLVDRNFGRPEDYINIHIYDLNNNLLDTVDDFKDYISKYYGFWQRLIPNNQLKSVLSPIWNDVKHVNTVDIFENVFRNKSQEALKPEDYVNKSLYLESKTFLHGLLMVEDKLSMAHSLESRVPFLDNDLVDFATKLPVNCKIANLKK